jgi:tetratricopeptide (TPR) repeat protein
MKASFTILAVVLAASLAMAQAKTQAGSQSQQATGQSGAQNATAGGTQASQPQPAAGTKRVLQPKSQEEYKAYQDAAAKTDPAEMAAAADAFAAKFPNSDLRELLYVRAMNLYQQNNNTEQEVAMGRKAIALDPTDPVPLIHVASALAETTRDTDLDREDRLKEAAKDAQAAINNIDVGLQIPPNTPPDKVALVKTSITAMAYETLGMVSLNEKDYAAAEQNLLKAADTRKASPDPVVYLRLSVAQDKLGKYPQALESANKAADLAQPGSTTQALAKQQQARLQKLISAGSSPTPAPASAPAPGKPATTQPASTTPATPPH